jgi:hypothetical protein
MKSVLILLLSMASVSGALVVYPTAEPEYDLNPSRILVVNTSLHIEGTRKQVRKQLDYYRHRNYRLTSYVRTQTNSIVYVEASYQLPLGPGRVQMATP